MLVTGAAIWALPWDRLPRAAQAVPPFAVFAVIALLRESHGGAGSGYAPLVLLPVLWFALYGTRTEVLAAVVGVAVTLGLPLVLTDDAVYPAGEWRRTAFYVVLSLAIGLTLNGLVGSLLTEIRGRERAEAELARLRAHEVNDDVVQGLVIAKLGLELGRDAEARQGDRRSPRRGPARGRGADGQRRRFDPRFARPRQAAADLARRYHRADGRADSHPRAAARGDRGPARLGP